jgi:hypothetical protein
VSEHHGGSGIRITGDGLTSISGKWWTNADHAIHADPESRYRVSGHVGHAPNPTRQGTSVYFEDVTISSGSGPPAKGAFCLGNVHPQLFRCVCGCSQSMRVNLCPRCGRWL